MNNMKAVVVRGRQASQLRELEPHFWEIIGEHYGKTGKGHTATHQARYKWLLKSNPNSVIYFASVNGTPVAAGLVIQKGQRWYSLGVSEKRLRKIEPDKRRRGELLGSALDLIAARISNNHPRAWGTVSAEKPRRIKFFTDRNWKVASTREEVLNHFRKMGDRYKASHFSIQIIDGHPPYARFVRDNATNGPHYAQVLLIPKK